MRFNKIVLIVDDYEDLGNDYVIEKLNEIDYVSIHVINTDSREVDEEEYDEVLSTGNFESLFKEQNEHN